MNPGRYFAWPKEIVITESKSGTPAAVITIEVKHIAQAGEWQNLDKPVERRMYLSFHENSRKYTDEKLNQLGFNWDFLHHPALSADIMDSGIEVEMETEMYEGKVRERWNLAGGGPPPIEPARPDVLRRLAAYYRDRGGKVSAPATTPAPARPATPPRDDDQFPPIEEPPTKGAADGEF